MILVTGSKGFIGQAYMALVPGCVGIDIDDPIPDLSVFSHVVHLGALSSTTETNVERVLHYNFDYSIRLYNLCQRAKIPFQYASSASVYGQTTKPSKESDPANPQSLYAWSKYLFDYWVQSRLHTAPVQGFRFFNVYNDTSLPIEDHKKQPSPHTVFTRQAKESGVIKLFEGSENYVRDFVPVSYVVDVLSSFAGHSQSGIWNVGLGKTKSFKNVAEDIAARYNAVIEEIPMPEHIKPQYQKYTCADTTKLKKHFKW